MPHPSTGGQDGRHEAGGHDPPSPADVPPVEAVWAEAFRVPTPQPEADGTLLWEATTIVVAQVRAGPVTGLGWTYADQACVSLIDNVLASAVIGRPVLDVCAGWAEMRRQIRNLGRPGLVSCAMSAVDVALWDAAARLLNLSLSRLLGRVRDQVNVYGSGGFTTQTFGQLTDQLRHWTHDQAMGQVKIKIGESWGSDVSRDLERVRLTRATVGDDVEIYVDANGGYSVGQAKRVGRQLAEYGVSWFEEPVSSDNLIGLSRLRDWCAADVAAGEYGYDLPYFARMAPVVDCLQVDVTRCGGFTAWFRAAAVAEAAGVQVSAHCAPNLSAHIGAATQNFRHIEWFADHDRIEGELFDGCLDPYGGFAAPSNDMPGHGCALRREVAACYRV
jgi:L-alanine-DL-glutamate epimerase-like enolase superfamily enzyme